MKENRFQADLVRDIGKRFPESIVLKNDPSYKKGIPDLLILYRDRWAALECKKEKSAHKQPNQEHYIDKMDAMSYASFIYPENREEVLHDLERAFKA